MGWKMYYGAIFLVVLILIIVFLPTYDIFSKHVYEKYTPYVPFNSDPTVLKFTGGASFVNGSWDATIKRVPATQGPNGVWISQIKTNYIGQTNEIMVPMIQFGWFNCVGVWDGKSGTADMGLFGKVFNLYQGAWGINNAMDHRIEYMRASISQNVPGYPGVIVMYLQWPGYGGAGQAANIKLGLYHTQITTATIPLQSAQAMIPTGPAQPPVRAQTAVFSRDIADTYMTMTVYVSAGQPATAYHQVNRIFNSTSVPGGPSVVQLPTSNYFPPVSTSTGVGGANTASVWYNPSTKWFFVLLYVEANKPPVVYQLQNIEGLSLV